MMTKSSVFFLLYFGCFIFLAHSRAELTSKKSLEISYEDLSKMVSQKNEKVQSAVFALKAQEERTGSWGRSFAPKFAIVAGNEEYSSDIDTRARQPYIKLNTSINVYRGGKDLIENDARHAGVRAARAEFSYELNAEIKEARQTYWKLIAIQKILVDRKESIKKNEVYTKSASRKVVAGLATNSDVLQFELHKTLLTQGIKKLEIQEDAYKNRLSTALGLDEHENLIVKTEFPKPKEILAHVEPLKAEQQLEIKTLNERRDLERLKQEQASRWWSPSVDLYSSYGVPSLSADYNRSLAQAKEFAFGVRVSFDLGEGGDALRESRARAHEALSLERKSAHRIREISAKDHELRHDIKLFNSLIIDSDRDIEKAEKFLKLTESEYNRGVKNGPDLISAFQKYDEFKDRRTELYREYYETEAELLAITAKESTP